MSVRKKPEGKEWEDFVDKWYGSNHIAKVNLAREQDVTYEVAKHWISESGATRHRTIPTPVVNLYGDRQNTPSSLTTKPGVSRAVVLGDTHSPYQDNEVVEGVEHFLGEIKPDYLFYNGDLNDFYQVSDFSKDPARLAYLQDDIDVTTSMFKRHRDLLPEAKLVFIEGTHENRWFKYLQDKAPAVSKLRGSSIPALYNLKGLGIEHALFERGVLVNQTFLIIHGDIVSKHSGATAKAHYEKNGGSGICNHTHRLGSFFHRSRFGTFGWWENGCLCQLNPDWVINPNWQQGFSVISFEDTGRFFVEQVPIIDGRFIYGGKLY